MLVLVGALMAPVRDRTAPLLVGQPSAGMATRCVVVNNIFLLGQGRFEE